MNQIADRFGGYTAKTYNLLALSLMLKNDIDRALKIFETAVAALSFEGEGSVYLANENKDISALIFNFIKCLCVKRGQC
jgi:hypothetical protein